MSNIMDSKKCFSYLDETDRTVNNINSYSLQKFPNVSPFISSDEDIFLVNELDESINLTKILMNDNFKEFSNDEIKKIFLKVKPKTIEIALRIKKSNPNNYIKLYKQMVQENNVDNFDFATEILKELNGTENLMFKSQLFEVYMNHIIKKGIGFDAYKGIMEKIKNYSRFEDGTKDLFDNGEYTICDYEFKDGHFYVFSPESPIIYIEKIEEHLKRYVFCYCDGSGKRISPLLVSKLLFKSYSCREIPKMFFLKTKLDLL